MALYLALPTSTQRVDKIYYLVFFSKLKYCEVSDTFHFLYIFNSNFFIVSFNEIGSRSVTEC